MMKVVVGSGLKKHSHTAVIVSAATNQLEVMKKKKMSERNCH